MLLLFVPSVYGQNCGVGAIVGERMGNRLRITDLNNACTCANPYNQPYTLHLLESGTPSLRFSSNGPAQQQVCTADFHATLSLFRGGQPLSIENVNDFTIVVDATANDLVLAVRDTAAAIRFATTDPNPTIGHTERVTMLNIGHVGISATDPKELLQIGPRLTFHVGYVNDFLGYNLYVDGTDVQRRIAAGYASALDFRSDGTVRLGLGGTHVTGNTPVNFQEPSGTFNGLSMKYDANGNGIYAFGMTPETGTRLAVRTQGNTSETNAVRVINSGGNQLLKMTNTGALLIGSGELHDSLTGPSLQVKGHVVVGDSLNRLEHANDYEFKLYVQGLIAAQEVVIRVDEWSDHVFRDNYPLMPLEDLRAFITEYGHLPNIPKEADVAARGVSLGEFQSKILEKVEELTLYVLYLAKHNKELEAELAALKGAVK